MCHIFICTNDRGGEQRSCADQNSPLIRKALKQAVNDRGWQTQIRVSQSGCMGLCANGPNVMVYPQKIWFSEVSIDDVDTIVSKVDKIINKG